MMLQTLVPGVEHAEEADLRAQVSRIARDLEQRGGAGAEQQSIDQLLVLERKRSQFTRQREDGMDVAGRQQFALALLSQRRRALPWHFGQCRLRHEL
jgi:glutamate synthase domain-containing protein 1